MAASRPTTEGPPAGEDAADGAWASTRAPHSPQNFCPGGFWVPQEGHTTARRAPHSPQNFCPDGFTAPQLEQVVTAQEITGRRVARTGSQTAASALVAEVPHSAKDVFARAPGHGGRPTDEIGTPSEQRQDHPILAWTTNQAPVHPPSCGAAGQQRRGRSEQPPVALGSKPAGLRATSKVGPGTPDQDAPWQGRTGVVAFIWNIDRPQSSSDSLEIGRVADLLMTDELRPGAIGRVCQVMDRTLTDVVPAAGELPRVFPQEGETRIAMSEGDHVAGEEARDRASASTSAGPGFSGAHDPRRRSAGARSSSASRFRRNHRRIPIWL